MSPDSQEASLCVRVCVFPNQLLTSVGSRGAGSSSLLGARCWNNINTMKDVVYIFYVGMCVCVLVCMCVCVGIVSVSTFT